MKRAPVESKTDFSRKDLLPEDDFDPKNQKVRITAWIDGEVLEALKKRAKKDGTKYQTLLNQILRSQVLIRGGSSFVTESSVTVVDIAELARKVEEIESEFSRLKRSSESRSLKVKRKPAK